MRSILSDISKPKLSDQILRFENTLKLLNKPQTRSAGRFTLGLKHSIAVCEFHLISVREATTGTNQQLPELNASTDQIKFSIY